MRDEVLNKLKELVANVKGVDIAELGFVNENTKIREDLGLNSVGVLYIVFAIEQEFNFRFEQLDFNSFNTVGDVLNYIEENI